MNKVRQFYQRAEECRILASKAATTELRGHYENLARTWEKLAEERKAFFIKMPEIGAKRPAIKRR